MEFDIDDIYDLVVRGSRRGAIINNYDLDSLKKMKVINCETIKNLRNSIQEGLEDIIDEDTRKRVLFWMKSIDKTLKYNMEFDPEEFFNKYDARQFSHQCLDICNFNGIIEFMLNIFMNFKRWEEKGDRDSNALYRIFASTKKACGSLGIFTADAATLEEAYMDPEGDLAYKMGIESDVVREKEDYNEKEITIRAIPYNIRFPDFRRDGEIMEYLTLPVNKAVCVYNLDKYKELVEQAKQKQER